MSTVAEPRRRGRPSNEELALRAAQQARQYAAGEVGDKQEVHGQLGDEVYYYDGDLKPEFGWLTNQSESAPWVWDITVQLHGYQSTRMAVPFSPVPRPFCWTFRQVAIGLMTKSE